MFRILYIGPHLTRGLEVGQLFSPERLRWAFRNWPRQSHEYIIYDGSN